MSAREGGLDQGGLDQGGLTLRVGAEVAGFERRLDIVDLVAYAGATWDWHRLHYDAAYLQRVGLEAPVVDGQVFGAYLVEHVQDWGGPSARVRSTEFRFRQMVYAGQTVTVSGTITAVDTVVDTDGARATVTVEQVVAVDGVAAVTGTTVVEVDA